MSGVALTEFDLDAALARKPELILVDELAHTTDTLPQAAALHLPLSHTGYSPCRGSDGDALASFSACFWLRSFGLLPQLCRAKS
jgi:hypothetical protein